MKKTANTKKLVLDRKTIRQLTKTELDKPVGGMHVDTHNCETESCHSCYC